MPLVKSSLASALQAVFESMPPTPDECAEALANAYADYAQTGAFGGGLPVVTGVHRDALKTVLLAAIATPELGLPSKMAAAWAAGVAAFWLAMPVAGATVGATHGCPGASSLTGSMTGVFANLANTAAVCANGCADALDTATKTVQALVTPPVPPADVPIS